MTVSQVFTIERHAADDALVRGLIAELQDEYVQRYGGPDETPIEPGEFDPPEGAFLVGLLDGDPVASGAWRRLPERPGEVEVKRLYVAARARGQGLSRRMMAALEASAADAGYVRVVLMTGTAQPEAIALYDSSGYLPIEGYGHYACAPDARFYAKDLAPR